MTTENNRLFRAGSYYEPGHWPLAELEGMEPEFYFEPTEEETRKEFVAYTKTYERLLDADGLSVRELREVSEGQALELLIWFLDLPPDKQQAQARTKLLREGLAKLKEARKRTREKAQRVLAKRGVVV